MLLSLVRAAPSEIVSVPVPPISVSTFETVATLEKLPRVGVSAPSPRSIEPLVMMLVKVIVASVAAADE